MSTQMVINIKEVGCMVYRMEKVFSLQLRKEDMKVIGVMGKKMETVSFF